MTDREAMQQALEHLDRVMSHGSAVQEAKNILRERLAQPEQEPVAWCQLTASEGIAYFDGKPMIMVGKVGNEIHPAPLYTTPPQGIYYTPPQRTWVGLTDEDWDEIFGNALTIGEAIKVTEAKLKEKNNG